MQVGVSISRIVFTGFAAGYLRNVPSAFGTILFNRGASATIKPDSGRFVAMGETVNGNSV